MVLRNVIGIKAGTIEGLDNLQSLLIYSRNGRSLRSR